MATALPLACERMYACRMRAGRGVAERAHCTSAAALLTQTCRRAARNANTCAAPATTRTRVLALMGQRMNGCGLDVVRRMCVAFDAGRRRGSRGTTRWMLHFK